MKYGIKIDGKWHHFLLKHREFSWDWVEIEVREWHANRETD